MALKSGRKLRGLVRSDFGQSWGISRLRQGDLHIVSNDEAVRVQVAGSGRRRSVPSGKPSSNSPLSIASKTSETTSRLRSEEEISGAALWRTQAFNTAFKI